MRVLWTLLFGPLLSLLPLRLRKCLPFYKTVNWSAATALSGLAEFILGVVLTLFWYDYSMTTWVNRAMDAALAGKLGPGVSDQAIGFSAYVVTAAPDALFARATAAGAKVAREPHDTDYGSRDFAVTDPDGNLWSFGTYPGAPRKS